MNFFAREAYFETQVLTATPQRLRLMLIEGAIRKVRAAQAAWLAGSTLEGLDSLTYARNIITELIAGIQPEHSDLAKQVLEIYMFLFRSLAEAQLSRDVERLAGVLGVLEEERQTWQAVCQQTPDRVVPAGGVAVKEAVAPMRVDDQWSAGYVPSPIAARSPAPSSGLSIEA